MCVLFQQEAQKAEQPASEELVDTAPIISSSMTPPLEQSKASEAAEDSEVSISVEELKELNQAVQELKADQDRSTLEELKEDREEYIEVRELPYLFRTRG
jgi:chemotaxis protein histidine kinase CheA